MNNLRQPISPAQAMNRAAALCARCEQAPSDIRAKLLKWGIRGDDVHRILDKLIEQGFLDEQRFAVAFVKDKFAFNGWGRIKIAHQLRQKGIPSEVIENAITAIDDEAYRERLIELLRSKWSSVKCRDPRSAWAAMMRFAASRGFEASLASDCVHQVAHIDVEDD